MGLNTARQILEIFFRIVAFLLAFAFLLGYLRFARTGGMVLHLWMLSQIVLMSICVASPSKSSRLILYLLLAAAGIAVVSSIALAYGQMSKILNDEHPETVLIIFL